MRRSLWPYCYLMSMTLDGVYDFFSVEVMIVLIYRSEGN